MRKPQGATHGARLSCGGCCGAEGAHLSAAQPAAGQSSSLRDGQPAADSLRSSFHWAQYFQAAARSIFVLWPHKLVDGDDDSNGVELISAKLARESSISRLSLVCVAHLKARTCCLALFKVAQLNRSQSVSQFVVRRACRRRPISKQANKPIRLAGGPTTS